MPIERTPTLRALKLKLKETSSAFEDIKKYKAEFPATATENQIRVRLEMVDSLWEQFCCTLVEIKSHDEYPEEKDGQDSYAKERQEFSTNYYDVKAFLLDKLKAFEMETSSDSHIRDISGVDTSQHVRLPQIKLQTFNGDIDDWLSFRDLFQSLIHCKGDLPDVEKFHYLKGCLVGEPRSLIDALPVTRINYQVAWNLLLKRYNNSKQLKKRQVQALFNLSALSKESAVDLHILTECFERVVQTLDQLIQPEEYKNLLLVNLLTSRLDPTTRRGWEEFSSTKEQDEFSDLCEFLHRRIRVLECLPAKSVDNKGSHQQPIPKPKHSTVKSNYNTVQMDIECVACKGQHRLHQCSAFKGMPVSDRDKIVTNNSLCRNCFRTGHQARSCPSKFSCWNCKGRHHTLVCFKPAKIDAKAANVAGGNHSANSRNSSDNPSSEPMQVANMAATDTVVSAPAHRTSPQVLLATAVILIEDDHGKQFPARALLDSGSESNFISQRLAQLLKVDRERVDITISGIGQASTKVKNRIFATVRSRISEFSKEMSFLVLPKVTVDLPTATFATNKWIIPEGVQLADPAFFQSKGVDVLLGIECFFEFFVTGRRINLGEQLPTLNESVFGWVASGISSVPFNTQSINCNVATSNDLDDLIARFWSSEEVDTSVKVYSPEERRCEENYQRTVQRNANGRYSVSLPKSEDAYTRLGESRDIAYRRLLGTERRLSRDPKLREQYTAFMDEYLQLGHMQKVSDTTQGTVKRCFLPHHPVVKEASTTTKVRVVFDASCKTSTMVSLNDVLLVGPVIQQDLHSIIIRSRTKQIMLVSDVEKMFRQIDINAADRGLQCILWRTSPEEEVGTYELNTVTYGTKPAPFLATRTLKQIVLDEGSRFPLASKAIEDDVYMDDVITGADDLDTARELRQQLEGMLASGGFRLRKWASNCPEVLTGVRDEDLALPDTQGINLDPDPSVKTLGLTWIPGSDVFKFNFNIPPLDEGTIFSKRSIMSTIATLFDPLGFIGAVIVAAKIFMQQLWLLQDKAGKKLNWDTPVPQTVGEKWLKFHKQLPLLNKVYVKRCIIIPGAVNLEIHCFSDASEKAYGCCLYMRSEDVDGNVEVHLISSKSRVAPLKTQSIPRLEVNGVLLAAQEHEKVRSSIGMEVSSFFWTDSMCSLNWIKAPPATWSTYIGNRVAKIQNLTEGCEINFVPGIENPADLISRGLLPEDIIDNDFWWMSASWVKGPRDQRPRTPGNLSTEEGNEERRKVPVAAVVATAEFNGWYISKFSSWGGLIRRTAYWLRLMALLRKPRESRTNAEFMSTQELKEAESVLIRRVQREEFAEEWAALSDGKAIERSSSLRWFNPYICKEGLIRVGGRLRHSQGSYVQGMQREGYSLALQSSKCTAFWRSLGGSCQVSQASLDEGFGRESSFSGGLDDIPGSGGGVSQLTTTDGNV